MIKLNNYLNIYELGEYINRNLKQNKRELSSLFENIYYKYENMEYPIILESNCAAEMYLNYYIDKYFKSGIKQDYFWEYIRIISESFKNNFEGRVNDSTILDKVSEFFCFVKNNNSYIYNLCIDKKLVVLLHDDINKKYKGSFNEEIYINNNCSVINIYQNNDNLDYIFVLVHELGHFLHKSHESKIDLLVEIDDMEIIADAIGIILLKRFNYNIEKLKLNDIYLFKLDKLISKMEKNNII